MTASKDVGTVYFYMLYVVMGGGTQEYKVDKNYFAVVSSRSFDRLHLYSSYSELDKKTIDLTSQIITVGAKLD